MSEFKGTPGPWMAVKIQARWNGHKPLFPDGTWHIVPLNDPERISICETCQGDDTDAETRQIAEHDARLIAAAPDLLEACRSVVAALAGRVRSRDALAAIAACESSIRKAQGEQL